MEAPNHPECTRGADCYQDSASAKLFVFLRQHRHELFDDAFQEELASLYRPVERGHPPVAPAMLALALILEAYTGISDDEVRTQNTVREKVQSFPTSAPKSAFLVFLVPTLRSF